jgi:hypothetical protein
MIRRIQSNNCNNEDQRFDPHLHIMVIYIQQKSGVSWRHNIVVVYNLYVLFFNKNKNCYIENTSACVEGEEVNCI